MGQTLENGVYLPSEGERNCYAGLKTNWEILDQKVADVTALQQAVAGALHREIVESLPTTDINPNTIYMVLSGTSATENVYNEFMYVNNAWELIGTSATDLTNYYTKADVDGKLLLKANDSDVVHKSGDETKNGELTVNKLISNSIQSATGIIQIQSSGTNRSVAIYNGSSAGDGGGFWCYGKDSANGSDCRLQIYNTSQSRYERVDLVNSQFLPTPSGELDCGGTSNKWKSVYATNYYYGNDNVEFSTKFVTTDTNQTISESKTFTNTIKSQKEIEFTGNRLAYILPDFSASYSGLNLCTYSSSGAVRIGTWKVNDNDNTKHILDSSLGYLNVTTGSINSVNCVYVTPRNATDSKLGDSVNKWKFFNNLEPSSLSLPDLANGIDISSYITDLSGGHNVYTPPANGYIVLRSTTANVLGIVENTTGMGSYSRGSNQTLAVNLPVVKNSSISIYAICSSLTHAKFIPCQGNV